MATITQRLAFLISANADQAIKAFDKTAIAAEKELGKAGKSIDQLGGQLTKFGAAGLAAAGTLGGGLFKLAQGAIEDQKSQALLAEQLRNTANATDTQIASVEKMIDATARATGVADDQLRPAMGNLVRAFGDTEKATSVLGTALDISAATGRDLETVTIALGRAANGNVGALSRLGIPLDENVKKSKDFTAALQALNEQFGGAAAARADTYAGKLDRAKVAISEAGESIGSAFIPFVETSATALANAINALGQFNEKTGGAVGKLAAFGTVGLGAVSTASLIAGQMIKLRDRFGEVDAETGKLTGKLTTLGRVVAVGSIGIGAAALLYADYTATKAKAEATTRDLADALRAEGDAQKTALAKLLESKPGLIAGIDLTETLGVKFAALADKTSASSKRLDELSAILKTANGDDLNIDLDKLNSLLGEGVNLTSDQAFQLRETVKQLQAARTEIVNQAFATQKANEILSENVDVLRLTDEELKNLTDTYKGFSDAILRNEERVRDAQVAKLIEQQAKREAEAEERRAKAASDFAKQVDELAGKLENKLAKALSTAEQNAEKANTAYKNYRDTISGSVSGVVNLGNAQATAEENTRKLADAKIQEVDAQGKLNELLGKQVDIDGKIAVAQKKVTDAQMRPDSDKKKADAIKDAERELNALLEDQTGIAKQVADARTDLATATKAVTDAEKAPLTFADSLAGQVTKAEGFKTNLQKVLDLGGDQALIDQLTSAGADAGNSIIQGILNSSDPAATVDQLDKTLANVAAFAGAIGTASADKFFGEGVKLADQLLAGVTEQLSKIDVEALAKSKTPLKALKRASKQFDSSLGFLFSENALNIPSLADGGIVPARPGGTLVRVGEGGQDEAVLPLPRSQGGSSIVINVNAGLGADGTQIGKQIVDELVAYQRRVGALPIKVSM